MTKYCLYFNGVNAYIKGPHLELQNHSIEVLAYLVDVEGHTYGQLFVSHGDVSRDYSLRIDNGGQLRYVLNLDGYCYNLFGPVLEPNKWYFIAATYDNASMKLYVNMEKYSLEVSGTIGPYYGHEFLGIGAEGQSGGGSWGFLHGFIAYVRIYSRVLSDSEIEQNFENPYEPVSDGLVLWLNFEEGCGDRVYDRSGNGNDGVIYGGARWLLFPGVGRWGRVWVDGLEVPCASSADFVRETSVEKLNELMFPKLQEKYFELSGLFDLSNPDHVYALAFLKNKLGRKVEVKFDNHMWITAYLKTITEQPTTQGKLKTTLKLLW